VVYIVYISKKGKHEGAELYEKYYVSNRGEDVTTVLRKEYAQRL
jgi:hypothetical protein